MEMCGEGRPYREEGWGRDCQGRDGVCMSAYSSRKVRLIKHYIVGSLISTERSVRRMDWEWVERSSQMPRRCAVESWKRMG